MTISTLLRKITANSLQSASRLYRHVYHENLLLTNLSIGVALFTGGDIFEQKVIERCSQLNRWRVFCMGCSGLLYGSGSHLWYTVMSKSVFFASRLNEQALFYMVFFCPLENAMFYIVTGFMEGETKDEVKSELSKKLLPTYLVDFCCYYPFLYFNLRFVPFHLRTTTDLCYGLVYSVFLSYMKHHDVDFPKLNLFTNEDDDHQDNEMKAATADNDKPYIK
jgi:Mpv17 / PMP22 family.